MLCLRICSAYSFRLTRRHSTILLLGSFIVSITLLLQLYAFRHHGVSSSQHAAGDYDYKPGSFLKGIQPSENESYCLFNYGLPEKLHWNLAHPSPSPEKGPKGPYRIIYNAIKGTAYDNASRHHDAVTYVTQATPEFLYHIVEIARFWAGPISLAVFTPNYDLDITMQIMEHLCHCFPGMAKVSLHIFYNKNVPPKMIREVFVPVTTEAPTNETVEDMLKRKKENYKNLNNETRAAYVQNSIKNKIKQMMVKRPKLRDAAPILNFNDCSGLESYDLPTYRRLHSLLYPINVGRNAARRASTSNYFLVSDIEMVPSERLASKFARMLRGLFGDRKRDAGWIVPKTVFVVPVFEVDAGERIARRKEELVKLVEENRAMYFHQKICVHCQRFPGMQTWLKTPAHEEVEPLMIARREYPYHRWEPLYFGTNQEPWYSENLVWEGQQDKMTQMLELCLQDYRLVILDGGFLCHAARDLSLRYQNPKARLANNRKYKAIVDGFKKRYHDRNQCKLYFGFKIKR